MASIRDVEAAEAKLNRAKDALLSYVEQWKELDQADYKRLVARVKKAEAEFMNLVSGL